MASFNNSNVYGAVEDEVQKRTDRFVAEVDKLVQEKEKEIMTV